MTKNDTDFDTWFDTLAMLVLDGAGTEFRDRDAGREDYDDGRNVHDVADEIIAEYNDE